MAVSQFWLVLLLNTAVPTGIQAIVFALGIDLLRAERDPLTGLLNRRAFYQRVAERAASQLRDGSYVAVFMIDLDDFKRLNDTLGHVKGDEALAAVGRALRSMIGSSTVVGRVGGEEFLVVVFASSADECSVAQSRLTESIRELPFAITASVGAASFGPWDRYEGTSSAVLIEILVSRADAAMYAAKRAGGNRVASHDDDPPSQ